MSVALDSACRTLHAYLVATTASSEVFAHRRFGQAQKACRIGDEALAARRRGVSVE
jgi:hypothetical protein